MRRVPLLACPAVLLCDLLRGEFITKIGLAGAVGSSAFCQRWSRCRIGLASGTSRVGRVFYHGPSDYEVAKEKHCWQASSGTRAERHRRQIEQEAAEGAETAELCYLCVLLLKIPGAPCSNQTLVLPRRGGMTNVDVRMSNGRLTTLAIRNPSFAPWCSSFFRHSCFDIRPSFFLVSLVAWWLVHSFVGSAVQTPR
jgi:hypothetical protein